MKIQLKQPMFIGKTNHKKNAVVDVHPDVRKRLVDEGVATDFVEKQKVEPEPEVKPTKPKAVKE